MNKQKKAVRGLESLDLAAVRCRSPPEFPFRFIWVLGCPPVLVLSCLIHATVLGERSANGGRAEARCGPALPPLCP
jgi:hypothetical protein